MLLSESYAFLQEHERCGELDGGVEGERVWLACECGARIERRDSRRGVRPRAGALKRSSYARAFHRVTQTVCALHVRSRVLSAFLDGDDVVNRDLAQG